MQYAREVSRKMVGSAVERVAGHHHTGPKHIDEIRQTANVTKDDLLLFAVNGMQIGMRRSRVRTRPHPTRDDDASSRRKWPWVGCRLASDGATLLRR